MSGVRFEIENFYQLTIYFFISAVASSVQASTVGQMNA